jgi:hypothetical protein
MSFELEFVNSSWYFKDSSRDVVGMYKLWSKVSHPFHGGNRGSNPRGDANKKSQAFSRHIELTARNEQANAHFRLCHSSSFFIILYHAKFRKIIASFVDSSWTITTGFCGLLDRANALKTHRHTSFKTCLAGRATPTSPATQPAKGGA